MAGPFELRRPAPPRDAPGSLGTLRDAPMRAEPSREVPAGPAAAPDKFLAMLRENGLVQDAAPPRDAPARPEPQVFSGLPQFGQFAREPIMPRPPEASRGGAAPPEPPAPPAEFKPGEPGQPKSGLTVHQLAKDEGLQTAVSKWFRTTGKQSIKGPDLMALLKEQAGMDMSVRQAAGLAKRLTQAETLRREDPARSATRRGAAKAMKTAKEG